jgi:hypothetical protein
MAFVGAEILNGSNGIVSADIQGRSSDALAPALPARDDGIGVNRKLPVRITGSVNGRNKVECPSPGVPIRVEAQSH